MCRLTRFILLCLSLLCSSLVGAVVSNKATAGSQIPLSSEPKIKRVAIIGAGISGAATAFFIDEYTRYNYEWKTDITVYEQSPSIGGRIKSVHVYDDHFGPVVEVGAPVFSQHDNTLVQLAQYANIGLENRITAPWSVWNGKEFVYSQGERALGWWDRAKLVLRYGWSPMRAQRLAEDFLERFRNTFSQQSPSFPFTSLTEAVEEGNMTEATATFGDLYMKEHDIRPPFVQDVVEARNRLSTGQELDEIHGISAIMGMTTDIEHYIEQGNWELVYGFVHLSNAFVELNTKVTNISCLDDNYFITTTKVGADDGFSQTSAPYDEVVIAAPFQTTNITMDVPLQNPPDCEAPYIPVHVTLFTSPSPTLSSLAFGKAVDFSLAPNILTARPPPGTNDLDFYSIRRLRNVTYLDDEGAWHTEYVFRIESPSQISDSEIAKLSGILPKADGTPGVRWMHRHVWEHGYLSQPPRRMLDDVELADGLYYTGGVEALWGTMQMGASMGQNVASLIVGKWWKEYEDSPGCM